jgi:hypothetical protein
LPDVVAVLALGREFVTLWISLPVTSALGSVLPFGLRRNIDLGVFSECEGDFLIKSVDEEIKKLVLVDFTVRLLGCRYTFNKQISQLTDFVMY